MGAPAVSDSLTSRQSSPLVLSTTAQACKSASPLPPLGSTTR